MREDLTLCVREYETLETDKLTRSQAQLLADKFGRYLTVQPSWGGGYTLRAEHYVGVIALDGLRILIQPKVPLDNLFFMLTYAYDLPEFRREETDLTIAADLFEFIVDIFARQIDELIRRGIHRAYVDREENDRFLRGRLLVAEHLRHNRILQDQIYQQRNDYTEDVLENQILRHTLALLSRQHYREESLRPRLRRAHSAFATVQPVAISPGDCDRVHYSRLNERYRSRVNLARLLLQHLSLEGQAGDQRFFAFLFDMNQIFELYVARYLKESFAAHPTLDIEIQPTIWLDTTQKERARPDLILRRNCQRVLIMDTKYKRFDGAPAADDIHQMIAYCHSMNVARSLLIYADPHPPDYRRDFHGIHLHVLSLPLHGELSLLRQHSQEMFSQLPF
jgi:5-methylcytosine-specific restriction enzyme subunit McrC